MPTLDQRVAALEMQLANLKRGTLALAPHQMGPRPGEAAAVTLRASRILPPNYTGAYMEIDLTQVPSNNTMGSSPAIHVNDGTRERVQMGNLPAYTDPRGVTSPFGYGFRVLDANGNILFDSIGISVVFTLLQQHTESHGGLAGTVADQAVCTTTFTTTRAQSVLLVGLCSGWVHSTGAGPFAGGADVYLQVTGQSASVAQALFQDEGIPNIGGPTSATLIQVLPSLPGNTYTAQIFWSALNGTADLMGAPGSFTILAFLMGG